ncbi:Oxysterol-binding protein-domain-containing protein [Crucibulum laeve]|uniref:Oxysterol-binding protein-domain-containing protein n=1 Tax=Crucibulum laeve TaxID=68775 RepID=A0A5C3LMF0_9AGAR|nr:Oxysterol-binding protein-domain-containing protein [Crucibulum laeve]
MAEIKRTNSTAESNPSGGSRAGASEVAGANIEPLYQVKLLSALRSGDPALIHPFIAEIGKDRRKSVEGDLDTGAAALHLAIRCASVQTVALLLSHRAISPNGVHPPGSGTTALHLASSLGRVDIVNLLLEQEGIDDTVRDSHSHSCKDVARNKEVVRAIDDSRAFLNASYRSLLRSYILSPLTDGPSPALIDLLSSPRIKFVDLSYLDDGSGLSLLHEAARRKDLRLIELAVRAGADVFVRNRKGKMAYEGAGKDDRVRVFLRQFANHDKTLIQPLSPGSEPPALKGYLNKYTNVARGYNTRWFVVKDGVFSYYRHQEDETVASRGSISMKTAVLKVSDRLRFEVHSTPSRGHHSGIQKWYMKANHPVEATRWTQALSKSIEWYKRDGTGQSDGEIKRRSMESDSSAAKGAPSLQSTLFKKSGARHSINEQDSYIGSSDASISGVHDPDISVNLTHNGDSPPLNGATSGEEDEDASSSADSESQLPPHDSNFELHSNTTTAQMELTSQLLNNLDSQLVPKEAVETRSALKDSFATVQSLLNEYVQMTREREEWWKKQLEKERERQKVWEESLATVVKEGEALENELRLKSRKRGSRVFAPSLGPGTFDSPGSGTLRGRPPGLGLTPRTASIVEESPSPMSQLSPAVTAISSPQAPSQQLLQISSPRQPPTRTLTSDTITPTSPLAATSPPIRPLTKEDEDCDTDEEDEFFDAIETNNLPNLFIPDSIASPTGLDSVPPIHLGLEPYSGYAKLRQSLNLSNERPSTSLWSVLKHSIGKDLTKISFPVFFNEPTSMLQRMAEDMEFSECLDAAASDKDPLRRLAFVAAFAMSNYSSTIGRIAKPFNPMLSETFEYVRIDRKYRYVSEQVSHHPPISACWAESPCWHYYGEVDAQNKFMGKSFEIRPTGVAHAELLLPEERAPDYPKAPGRPGKVLEHYSWKKVTTNVSGFILGSPTIDHYGDMVITNHRTGDQCILTFKPRGWRGKDAYEISGQVLDSRGNVAYEIAGRWNSQLVAKQHGVGAGSLHPDMTISGPNSPSLAPEYVLLWRNSEKPPGSPFNLTPFAITLNDCPKKTLKPYLCPTDCRLRPDQRAFEIGKYEEANGLKHDQEEKQREIRKAREQGRLPLHKPRWFRAETDGDTGERVWTPVRINEHELEYWAEREKAWKNGGDKAWTDVQPIFIEEPDFIKEYEDKSE